MDDLIGTIKQYLEGELREAHIVHVDIAHECGQEFHVNGKPVTWLRLLSKRKQTYDPFLTFLLNAQSRAEIDSFKLFVHAKANPEV